MPDIVLLLDESLSMSEYTKYYIKGINILINEQKQINPELSLTLIKFNEKISVLCHNTKLKSIPEITNEHYKPDKATALYDAIGAGILSKLEDKTNTNRVIMIIVTDGEDNCSQKFKEKEIAEKIKELTNKGWLFLYLGVGTNVINKGKELGIKNCVTYSQSESSIRKMIDVCNIAIGRFIYHWTGVKNKYLNKRIPNDISDLISGLGKMSM